MMNNLLNGLLVVASGLSLCLTHCHDEPATAEPSPKPSWHEAEYAEAFALRVGGEDEVTLQDRTRVDVMTGRVAWEVDYAPNWYEAVGQALHYGHVTERRSGVALIYRPDERYLVNRCRAVCERYGIALATCQAPE